MGWRAIGDFLMRNTMITRKNARVMLSVQFLLGRAIEINNIAKVLGISRHRLLILTINAGIPAVVAAQAGKVATQQTTAIKE